MGLANSAAGRGVKDSGLMIRRQSPTDRVVALAGNPNVGKSTVFNGLTGLNQHTGNWPGKTVVNAQGACRRGAHSYVMVDVPGAYSLMAHSAEEEVARNFICFDAPDAVVVVCDGTCLMRNLNLVLQTLEITGNVVVCVNLMDEAERKGIRIDLPALSRQLGVPVVGTVARKKKSLLHLLDAVDRVIRTDSAKRRVYSVRYPAPVEDALALVEPLVAERLAGRLNSRWLGMRLIEGDPALMREVETRLGAAFVQDAALVDALAKARQLLAQHGVSAHAFQDMVVSALVTSAEAICREAVTVENDAYDARDRKLDRILTSRYTGYPIMLALLALVFYLTITGANYPSALLADALFYLQDRLTDLFVALNAPDWLHGALVLGVYRTLAWVVSVMLPPMAIFFPLFTLLEDAGYLPRIAYNLDKPFERCRACGKQALTMCMVDDGMRKEWKSRPDGRRSRVGLWGGLVDIFDIVNASD